MIAPLLLAAALVASAAAPKSYVTQNYNLRFLSPPRTMICPLPKDWVGSDHGTTLFLSTPGECGPAGYPSSGRSSSIDAPRIDVYYGYWLGEDAAPVPCRALGAMNLLGQRRPLYRIDEHGKVRVEAHARYHAYGDAELTVGLVTTPDRLDADLRTLRAFAATVRTCQVIWFDRRGRRQVAGAGSPCPKSHWW
jgi:hypothetical protein